MDQSKIQACVRIADEYRAAAALKRFALREDAAKARPSWRAAFPDRWNPTLVGRVSQATIVVLLLPLSLPFIYLVIPIIERFSARNRKRELVALGQQISKNELNVGIDNIYSLWLAHGLSERLLEIPLENQAECLERWVDALYGGGMGAVLHVRSRVLERRDAQARAYAQMAARGALASFVDPVDGIARDLSDEIPPFSEL